jgi:hypothetical protein
MAKLPMLAATRLPINSELESEELCMCHDTTAYVWHSAIRLNSAGIQSTSRLESCYCQVKLMRRVPSDEEVTTEVSKEHA